MGMVCLGVTHCIKHLYPLDDYGKCSQCELEKEIKKEDKICPMCR